MLEPQGGRMGGYGFPVLGQPFPEVEGVGFYQESLIRK